MFPSNGSSNPAPRFPAPGNPGKISPASQVLSGCSDFLPPLSPRSVSFARRFHPTPDGDDRISQVPVRPPCLHAPLSDSGGTSTPGLYGVEVLSSHYSALTVSTSAIRGVSELNHAACWLAVYASCADLSAVHARLASGWWPTFAGQGRLPVGSLKKVSSCS